MATRHYNGGVHSYYFDLAVCRMVRASFRRHHRIALGCCRPTSPGVTISRVSGNSTVLEILGKTQAVIDRCVNIAGGDGVSDPD